MRTTEKLLRQVESLEQRERHSIRELLASNALLWALEQGQASAVGAAYARFAALRDGRCECCQGDA